MTDYYAHMNLPKPVVPDLPTLALLKGQTALVTGANSVIGRAIAVALGNAGANVVINSIANRLLPRTKIKRTPNADDKAAVGR